MFKSQLPHDGGIIYAETNPANFFPEPINGLTAAIFLGIAVYFTVALRGRFKDYPFFIYCLALLYIGGIGGTMYHGLRIWPIFRLMDWLPIMLLCLSAGVYFLAKLTRWYWALVIVGTYIGFNFMLREIFKQDMGYFVNINYAMMAFLVLLPVVAYLQKTRWKNGQWVLISLVAFVFALTFRIADKWEWLGIGTHFLWHIFGAAASYCMLNYVKLSQPVKFRTARQ